MMPMEIGSGFAPSDAYVAVPLHASVSVAGSAACATQLPTLIRRSPGF